MSFFDDGEETEPAVIPSTAPAPGSPAAAAAAPAAAHPLGARTAARRADQHSWWCAGWAGGVGVVLLI